MSTPADKPDLLLPASKCRPVREVFGVAGAFGLWSLLLTERWMHALTNDGAWWKTFLFGVAACVLWWLTMAATLILFGMIAALTCRVFRLAKRHHRGVTTLLIVVACSALALWLVCRASVMDRALGTLWFMGVVACLGRRMLR